MACKLDGKRINKLSDMFEILDNYESNFGFQKYYFRGESNEKRDLLPKLCRENTLRGVLGNHPHQTEKKITTIQKRLLERLRRYAAHKYDEKKPTEWEWICVAQHHRLPTLLLDWTVNPLVSLYFAIKSFINEKDGCLYVMQLKDIDERIDLTVRVGHNVNSIPVSLEESKTPIIVIPLVFTRRIESQSSRFLYMGNLAGIDVNISEDDNDNKKKTVNLYKCRDGIRNKTSFSSLSLFNDSGTTSYRDLSEKEKPWIDPIKKYIIPKESKGKILDELRKCQINEGTLFSDLDGYAQYLGGGGD